jgi:predicted PolB exonuclease-like 3'-5' exonuclease
MIFLNVKQKTPILFDRMTIYIQMTVCWNWILGHVFGFPIVFYKKEEWELCNVQYVAAKDFYWDTYPIDIDIKICYLWIDK